MFNPTVFAVTVLVCSAHVSYRCIVDAELKSFCHLTFQSWQVRSDFGSDHNTGA